MKNERFLQVTCIRGRQPDQERRDLAAARPRHRTTPDTPGTVTTRTRLILSVLIKPARAAKVGMPPALLNPASKALISKSGPPHDHFNFNRNFRLHGPDKRPRFKALLSCVVHLLLHSRTSIATSIYQPSKLSQLNCLRLSQQRSTSQLVNDTYNSYLNNCNATSLDDDTVSRKFSILTLHLPYTRTHFYTSKVYIYLPDLRPDPILANFCLDRDCLLISCKS